MNNNRKIILLCINDPFSRIVYNYINNSFPIAKVFLEEKVSKTKLLKNRIKKLGILHVFGQLLFQAFLQPVLKISSGRRISEIYLNSGLSDQIIDPDKVVNVTSVNSQDVIERLKIENPDLLLINGTRILSPKLVSEFQGRIMNIHAGITPDYRGVHGGYWALVNKDKERCGVTVHFVDAGIDTGNILRQETIHPSEVDNFITYPYLQIASGIQLLESVIEEFFKGKIAVVNPNTKQSRIWFHPTISQYLYYRIFRRVK